jgi:hypothetical protein
MLMTHVVLGNAKILQQADVTLTAVRDFFSEMNASIEQIQPPRGYDSVVGVPGVGLNYGEEVVYTVCSYKHSAARED